MELLRLSSDTLVPIAFLIVWGLLLIGYGRGTAHSIPSFFGELSKFAVVLLIIIGFFVAGIVFAFLYVHHRYDGLQALVFLPLFYGVVACCLVKFIVFYVVCPLVILKKEQVHTTITNYYISYDKTGHGRRYVCFGESPYHHFRAGIFAFQKFRNKIGVPVSYIKYKCPLNVYYIRKTIVEDKAGKSSQWETSYNTKSRRRTTWFVLTFLAVSVFLLLVVFGITGTLPWQS